MGSTVTGEASRVGESGVLMLDELESPGDLSESSNEFVDEADEEPLRLCISGASKARTFVVDRSSIGKEI